MNILRIGSLLCFAMFVVPSILTAEEISFTKQIAPILVKQCVTCHGEKSPKGSYQLHTFQHLMKSGESTLDSVTAEKLADSYLFELITTDDADIRMPKKADALSQEQVELVQNWIKQGAKFDGKDPHALLSSIIPKTKHPDAPNVYARPIPISAIAFHPNGKEIAVEGYHEVTIWNPEDGKLIRRIGNLPERTHGLDYNADGSLLAIAGGTPSQSGEVKLINTEDRTPIKSLVALSDVAFDVKFSPDGKKVASCSADRTIRIFAVESGEQLHRMEDHADWVSAIAWSPNGKHLASASRDKTAKIFNAETGESEITYPDHNAPVYAVTWSGDGKNVISAGEDKSLHYWNPADGKKNSHGERLQW